MSNAVFHWLDTRPAVPTGVTWGCPCAQGTVSQADEWHIRNQDGDTFPMQHWALAYWPDGSIKWLGCAAVLGPDDGSTFQLVSGAGPAAKQTVSVACEGIEVIAQVDTGTISVEVGDRGCYLIQEVRRGDRSVIGGVRLRCILEQRQQQQAKNLIEREEQLGIIESAQVEQSGPVRAVIALRGRYRGCDSGRLWLPFTARLIFYAGCDTIELVHSFIFDGDAKQDFIAGLGVDVHALLHEGVHNRHVRVVGEACEGVWQEALRMLPYKGHESTSAQDQQRAGQWVNAPGNGGMLPVWNDVQLFQDSADHAVLRKRQGDDYCWVDAEHCRRAPGIMSLSEPAAGVALAMRDFWQAHPSCLETRDAGGSEAHVTGWWWSPEAPAMDLRHYGGRDHRPVYEARNPDPEVYSNAYGIARTSQASLVVLGADNTGEQLLQRSAALTTAPVLVADPAAYHGCKVFGQQWAPVDCSTPARQEIEERLADLMQAYPGHAERWRWYGFWHYGDFMHTYDMERHCWHYDQGGRAWHNTEMASDIWPWLMFIRSGKAAYFRFAEAMTRHNSEVDVFHMGPWTAQGTRHNVTHWGCPCKEPRVSQAGAKRFYHFLTADERCADLLDEVAENVDRFKATNVPTGDRVMARIGPTWIAWVANWMCAWERSGDEKWRHKISAGLRGILAAPFGLLQGDPFDYDPATGAMQLVGDIRFPTNRLAYCMGGMEVLMELSELLNDAELDDAIAVIGELHAVHPEQAAQVSEAQWSRTTLIFAYARAIAWTARKRGDKQLAQRAWTILLEGDADPREHEALQLNWRTQAGPARLSAEAWQEYSLTSNLAAKGSLNAIALLAMVPDALEERSL